MAGLYWYNVVIINTIRLIKHDHSISCVYDLKNLDHRYHVVITIYRALMRNVFKSENLTVED